MIEQLIQQVEAAIVAAEKWAETGWSATFGVRNNEVSSLKQAEALPRNAVYRLEAINYWKQVLLAGEDTARFGRKALEALKDNNLAVANDALYFCQFVEKPFCDFTNTWLPLYEAIQKRAA
uniref:Uncharacterized protein n=1 Tax=Chlorobium chlorochromatii (strain CaD3) TaxID=340177 RepID=Q3AP74_CHLCH